MNTYRTAKVRETILNKTVRKHIEVTNASVARLLRAGAGLLRLLVKPQTQARRKGVAAP